MRLLSNIIKSAHINISSTNKYSVETTPINNEIMYSEVLEKDPELPYENLNGLTEKDIIELAEQKAEEIITEAYEKANDLKTQTLYDVEVQIEQIKTDAQKLGYDSGYSKAIEEINVLKNEVQIELEDTIKQKNDVLDSIEPQMLEMVLNISKTIFEKAMDVNPQIILLLIKKGLSQASTNGKIFIHICKEQYDVVVENISQIVEGIGNSDIEIIKDLSLNKGDCIIETPFGNIDSSFDQQFESIKNDLTYILENR